MGWKQFNVPLVNKSFESVQEDLRIKLLDQKLQKRVVLVIVSIALLLDNMLYMVIVPIIPIYFRQTGVFEKVITPVRMQFPNGTYYTNYTAGPVDYVGEDTSLGFLFASKAIVQIFVGPFSGTIIDRIGYEIPMVIGLIVMFCSTAIFALGQSYGILFFARALQGLGSAFADTSGLAMIADRFTEEQERSKALGIALAFISFGCLVAPPFGSLLYNWFGKPTPFFILSLVCLADGLMVFAVIQPKKKVTETGEVLKGTPIWRLFMDPYIAVCSGALIMANVSLAFLEPTITPWMRDNMQSVSSGLLGMIWLPPFFPHVAGVYFTVVMMRKYPRHPWLLAAIGLAMEGLSCVAIPFATNFWVLTLPLCTICFGIALIDTSVLPLLGYLVDTRHVSVYGSVYAIADISYSLAYAVGPIIAGEVVAHSGFDKLNYGICVSNLLYTPFLFILRSIYMYKPFENDAQTLGDDEMYERFDGGGGEQTSIDDGRVKTYGAVSPTANGGWQDGSYGGYGGDGGSDLTLRSGAGNPGYQYSQDYPQPEYPASQAYGGKNPYHQGY